MTQPDTPATVTPVGSDKKFAGSIWQVAPVIDPQTRLGNARISIPFAPELRPGGFAAAEIRAGTVNAPLLMMQGRVPVPEVRPALATRHASTLLMPPDAGVQPPALLAVVTWGRAPGTKPGQYRHRTKCLSSPFVADV